MEYSSMIFALFFLAEYNHIIVMSSLITILFFGGWSINGLYYITIDFFIFDFWYTVFVTIFYLFGMLEIFENCWDYFYLKCEFLFNHYISPFMFLKTWILESFIFFLKINLFSSLFIIIRACVPRYKYTQLLRVCWELFIPVSFIFFLFYILVL
jgi:NADH:ubiquinone oxidoreductase subunit H